MDLIAKIGSIRGLFFIICVICIFVINYLFFLFTKNRESKIEHQSPERPTKLCSDHLCNQSRFFAKMRESTSFMCYESRAQGWFFIGLGSLSFMVFVYAAILSNFFTVSEYSASTTIKINRYYCFLVPLTIPILFVAVYFHWLSMKFFKHA